MYTSAVTGCSSGIGQALAEVIAQSPNRVVATARKVSALTSIPDSASVLKLQLDVTSQKSIDTAFKETLAKFGRVDVVVNNAGYTLAGDTEGAEDGEARAVLDTNFWGMVNVTKSALAIMREENPKTGQQGGVIVNISSMGGWTGYPGQAFYHASKFAMEGFTESVAKELPAAWNSKSSLTCLPSHEYHHVNMIIVRSIANRIPDHSPSNQYRARWSEDQLCN